MPLSEHEQRLLDEMERNLYGTDSDVHSAPLGGMPRPNYRAIVLGAVVVVAGLGALLGGVVSHLIVVGIAGFAVMFAGVLIATRPGVPLEFPPASGRTSPRSKPSFMQRMEARWEQRDDGR
jgi:hypothetical protein